MFLSRTTFNKVWFLVSVSCRSWCSLATLSVTLALAARGLSLWCRGRVRSGSRFRRVFFPSFLHSGPALGAALTPILWQIGYAGVRVGEASHPGPAPLTTEGASPCADSLNLGPLSLASAPAASPAALAPGPTLGQSFHPYVAVPGSLPAPPARPSHFCSPATLSQPVPPPLWLPCSLPSSQPFSCSFLTCPRSGPVLGLRRIPSFSASSCPDHAHPSHGWVSCHPDLEAHQVSFHAMCHPSGRTGFGTCEVCQRILSLRFNGRYLSCFHVMRLPAAPSCRAEGAPTIWDVFTSRPRVRSSVPAGARDAWSRCLVVALSDVIAHRDVRSWADLLTLPALVLAAPSRGGRRHTLRLSATTRTPMFGLGQRNQGRPLDT